MNTKQLVSTAELTVLATVGSFLGAVSQLSGATFDGKHLAAAGIGALVPLAYKLSGIIGSAVTALQTAKPAAPAAAPVAVVQATPPPQAAP